MMKCAFCRNDNATNEHPYEGDFVFYMCDDCDSRYKQNKQLGPKFLICKCGKEPKELELEMAKSEILQNAVKNVSSGSSKGDNYERFTIDEVNEVKEVSKMPGKRNRSNTTRF
jgi:hypothetical protein